MVTPTIMLYESRLFSPRPPRSNLSRAHAWIYRVVGSDRIFVEAAWLGGQEEDRQEEGRATGAGARGLRSIPAQLPYVYAALARDLRASRTLAMRATQSYHTSDRSQICVVESGE